MSDIIEIGTLAPIVLFVYCRPWHTRQTVEALRKNELASQSELFVFSDGPKDNKVGEKVNEVRNYIRTIDGFKKITIIERDVNWGLANNIIDGVTKIVNEYGKIIVLEDDLVTSPYFLKFLNEGLEIYKNDYKVCQIVGYSYFEKYKEIYQLDDILFIKGADCLGWATWDRAWKYFNPNSKDLLMQLEKRNLINEFNWDGAYDYYSMLKSEAQGKINSWAIRWLASASLNDLYTLYPTKSLVLHIGNDEGGTNYLRSNKKDPLIVPLSKNPVRLKKIEVAQLENAKKAYIDFLSQYKISFVKKCIVRLLKLLNISPYRVKLAIKRITGLKI